MLLITFSLLQTHGSYCNRVHFVTSTFFKILGHVCCNSIFLRGVTSFYCNTG
jgi:hypothetical protein